MTPEADVIEHVCLFVRLCACDPFVWLRCACGHWLTLGLTPWFTPEYDELVYACHGSNRVESRVSQVLPYDR